MLQAAIVGMGRWGRTLVDAVQGRSSFIRMVAAVSRRPGTVADYAGRQGMRVLPSLDEALADPGIDAIVIATPHGEHHRQILQSLAAGKHVFVEKPMVMTRTDAVEVVAAAQKAGRVLCVGHNRRFLPAYRAMQDLAREKLGEPLQRLGNFSWATAYSPDSWRLAEGQSPAGGMSGMGIHTIDALIGLGARAKAVDVVTRRRPGVALEDTVTALLDLRDGSLGVLTTMTHTARIWRLEMFGTGGWAAMDGESRLVHTPAGGPQRSWDFVPAESERLELEAFAEAAAGRAAYPVTLEDAIHGVAVFEAICRAAEDAGGGPSRRTVAD